jgi:Rrf2 family protein
VILSKSATYAVRSTLKLSEERDGSPVRVDDIADALGVPRNYLSKILHQLARTRILESTRGPGGGFRLAVEPEELKLAEIVEHFDDVPAEDACLLGRGRCSAEHPCGAHERWSEVRAVIKGFLEDTSLEDLARDPSADERLELSSIALEVPD